MKKHIAALLVLMVTSPVWAATYYVSTEGNDSWDGTAPAYVSGTTGPKLTPVAAAALLTSSGDTLYFRSGTYNIDTPTSSRSVAIYPRADHCTFMPYNGESVTLQGSSTGNYGVAPTNGVIGVDSRSYTMIDGFTIKGIVMLDGDGSYNTVQNCDISVGCDSWSGNEQGELILVQGNNYPYQNYFTVKNNKIHDNGTPASGGGNAAMMFCYRGSNGLIENNDIYNSCGPGISLKDSTNTTVIRKNFIYNNAYAGLWSANQGHAWNNEIYQNIFYNNNTSNQTENYCGAIQLLVYTSSDLVYNNTFYANHVMDLCIKHNQEGTCDFFNNISHSPTSYHISLLYSNSWSLTLGYIDYNDYYNDLSWDGLYAGGTFSTLADWQSYLSGNTTGSDANSVITDPGFLNASGTYSLATDFKRSSYTANGRGGDYPSVMGAYITGSETIGYSESEEETPPSTPTITGVMTGIIR